MQQMASHRQWLASPPVLMPISFSRLLIRKKAIQLENNKKTT